MTQKHFNISCGCPMGDKLINNTGLNSDRNQDNEDGAGSDHVRVIHSYIDKEILVPSFEPYRFKEIDYGEEFNISNNKFLSFEEKKKAYNGEEDHIFCGRFPHLSDCGCKYPCSLILPKIHPIEVIDNVYCGPLEVAIKVKELLFLKINFILNLSCVAYNKRSKYFKYYDIFINDNHTENAIKYFKITNRFIEDAVDSGGKILIHSENGISRCWVFLMAYLIGRKHMTFNVAYDLVRYKFNHVEPNDNFLTQLKHYDLKVNV